MKLEIFVNGTTDARARYVGWAPSPCRIRVTDPEGAVGTANVELRGQSAPGGGQIEFYAAAGGQPADTLTVQLPMNGAPVDFFVAGKFGSPSSSPGDVAIEAVSGGAVVGSVPIMVRVRKDADRLTAAERDRFLAAMAQLNNQGMGRFSDFRAMHVDDASDEAHGFAGFLPWHRAYLLDLERELQAFDPSVALPYWRFDVPAPNLFKPEFAGVADNFAVVHFGPSNPLQFWATDGVLGVSRMAYFDTQNEPANRFGAPVRSEADTIEIAASNGDAYAALVGPLEADPHGQAHVSFGGFISAIHTAARDPVFFLLHCNVDRLWARWQWLKRRFDGSVASYPFRDRAGDPGADRIGHNARDTMWPWNGDTNQPRPSTAPGGGFAGSLLTDAPGAKPTLGSMIDYQGLYAQGGRLGFDYDDVPFEP